jgi:cation-transporting P-type ATPase 13A2
MAMDQAELEANISFLGIAFLSNSLKADTTRTIETLKYAQIPANMITGDHINTAVAIAGDCGLLQLTRSSAGVERDLGPVWIIDSDPHVHDSYLQISSYEDGTPVTCTLELALERASPYPLALGILSSVQLAITARGLKTVVSQYPKLVPSLVQSVRVFARMKPADKKFIVEELLKQSEVELPATSIEYDMEDSDADGPVEKERGSVVDAIVEFAADTGRGQKCVMFCGDGANDMAALRASTVGVSLCEAESSVAAPITSRHMTPWAVIETIKEGRCSLMTAYVLVCFTIEYAMIQLFMICNMFSFGLKIGSYTYLIHDLFFTLILALIISRTPPYPILGTHCPPQRFFTKYFLFKLFSQLICFPIFQLIAIRALSAQSWYTRYEPDTSDPLHETYADENSVIAFIGLVQVMIASVVSTVGPPYRMPWYTNRNHLICLVVQGVFIFGLLFASRNAFTTEFLKIKPMPVKFCFLLSFIGFCNAIVSGLLAHIGEYFH